ncbi:hypothetical protein EYF80_011416 [Liparis tanakae]|uniref:Uncharacterized protein n=1 Tax=Liparis tanakae TaxID=230148 RepID=A0A4Z2IMK0_9TELE|nr:hypothetical protein EYF80_011416 [Liparis tanakae]
MESERMCAAAGGAARLHLFCTRDFWSSSDHDLKFIDGVQCGPVRLLDQREAHKMLDVCRGLIRRSSAVTEPLDTLDRVRTL